MYGGPQQYGTQGYGTPDINQYPPSMQGAADTVFSTSSLTKLDGKTRNVASLVRWENFQYDAEQRGRDFEAGPHGCWS